MISHSEHEEFQAQGFLVFDPQIDAGTIDRAVARMQSLYLAENDSGDRSGKVVAYRDNRRVQDAWKIDPSVKAIATAPRVLEILAALYGRKPLPFQTLNFRVGTEQQPHSDTIHFNSSPAGFMCGVWVALEDIDRDNGPVVYFPGSQKWSEVALADVDAFEAPEPGPWSLILAPLRTAARDTNADYAKYERLIRHRIAATRAELAHATIRKGQALVWAANLVHGGSPQLDRRRTRASQVTHFFFEGCRYYTPVLQRGWKTRWRKPDWVR
jgi:ectoine hydroxylase-related dioxygenase (phytanoyl-CoA dioxygenase family)